MKKKVLISLAIILLLFLTIYLLLDAMLGFGYKINIVDGKPAGFVLFHDEQYYKDEAIKDRAIVIRDDSSRLVYRLSDLGADVKVTGYESSRFTINTQNLSYEVTTGEILPKLREDLEELLSEKTEGSVGHFDVVDNEITIVDSEHGNMFDIDAILSYIALRINYEEIVSVDTSDYTIDQDVSITEKQEELESILSQYSDFSISYTDNFIINDSILLKYGLLDVKEDSIDFIDNEDKVIKMLVSNLVNYNSVGIDRRFHTHDGKDITVTGGTYGDYIDYSEEAEAIIPMIKGLQSESDRVPIMKQEAKFSLDTTYIEVDKTKQHVYYYEDGELVLDTDVVTGKPTHDRQTPSGVYFILNKTKDANLIGATWNVKSDRWMGVTYQGVGFHDASWRSSFGGEIYKANGSHGCINTPKDAMFKLYDMVVEGTPVVIY